MESNCGRLKGLGRALTVNYGCGMSWSNRGATLNETAKCKDKEVLSVKGRRGMPGFVDVSATRLVRPGNFERL